MDEEEKLLRLYDLEIKREDFWNSEHQKRIAFFAGLISALTGAIVAGVLQCNEWYYCAILSIGPIIIVYTAKTAEEGTKRLYQRWLETVSTLMKYEEDLGLAKLRNRTQKDNTNWVAREQFITKRHMDSRLDIQCNSSKEWVDKHMKTENTYQSAVIFLFQIARILGWFLFVSIVIITLGKLVKEISILLLP